MQKQYRSVLVLSGCQATLQITGATMIPELTRHTHVAWSEHLYLGSCISLGMVCLVAMLILTRLDIPMLSEQDRRNSGRPLAEIVRQPVFVVAVLAAMLSYGFMNLLMTSTPLAMRAHHHPFDDTTFVLSWHMIGMYAPSFVTGSLIQRFAVLSVILVGIGLMFLCIVAALAGTTVVNFRLAMFLLGVGRNFMYIGGSALLTECHTPAERAKTQAANDFMVFATMAVSSTSSGLLLSRSGWQAVGYGSVPFLGVATSATLRPMRQRRASWRRSRSALRPLVASRGDGAAREALATAPSGPIS